MIKVEDIYPITVITYPDGQQSMQLISDDHLRQYTQPGKLEELYDELIGQTRSIEGVYAGDVERWLNHRGAVD